MALRRKFESKREEVIGELRKLIMRSLMTCTPHKILFRR
jgi:predicted aconitase